MNMTRHRLLSTALLALFGIVGLSATEPKAALTKQELKTAITNATTPADHQRIAAYYQEQADNMLAEAKEHDELAALYAKSLNPVAVKMGRNAEHCKYFAQYARKAAQQDKELAKMHEDMAKQAMR